MRSVIKRVLRGSASWSRLARARCSGFIHAWLAQRRNVNDIAVGIAMIIFGSGIAFFLGKPFIQPLAPQLPGIDFGGWTTNPALKAALRICPLFFLRSGGGFRHELVF